MSDQQVTDVISLATKIQEDGFSFVSAAQARAWLLEKHVDALDDWAVFDASWESMPLDEYMADGGRYRRRRFATLSAESEGVILLEPHQPHYQSREYNSLNGGVARMYEPIPDAIVQGQSMQGVLHFCRDLFSQMRPKARWHIECHQFRIEASQQEHGQPAPEGVHRDGVDYVLVMMVKRVNISSGTTTLHDLNKQVLDSFTLTNPLDWALVDDKRRMHGVTPVEQIDPALPAYRDVLVMTFTDKSSV
ncbi:2OG-Fe dioxygenase family protein [Methylobacillus gramineus]|uniref:2OG-Fe dioxygenase family protein n=1 Tax=Methylobacillus gramineus TaxID=755169 RepID=UPI001D0008D3|nr:2OG-Fe dioxygenase family protein [Methylobacillus gramineus]MCB5185828.1 2OG-Fe dioxygenase family protein [Methylobacillus gramineus]